MEPKSAQTLVIYFLMLLVVMAGIGYQQWIGEKAEKSPLAPEQQVSKVTTEESNDRTERWRSLPMTTTNFFRLIYPPQDAALVQTVAPALDPLYRTMWQAVHPSVPTIREKIQIEVVTRTMASGWQLQSELILVSSAGMAGNPETAIGETVLMTTFRDALAGYILAQSVDTTKLHPQWQLALIGFRQWLRTVPARQQTESALSPPCLTQKRATLSFPDSNWAYLYRQEEGIELAQMLVIYVHKEYGPTYIQAMLQAFADYPSWQTLIPFVFGRSTTEFAAEWQRTQEVDSPNCSQTVPQIGPKLSGDSSR